MVVYISWVSGVVVRFSVFIAVYLIVVVDD